MQQQNVFQYLRNSLKNSGVLGRLLLVNAVIFLILFIFGIAINFEEERMNAVLVYLAAPGDPSMLAYVPWTVITSMFTHYEFAHFILNMLVFFFTGVIFLQHFSQQRLLSTYILGGIFAYVVHVASYYIFPAFAEQTPSSVVGASGAIMAIFMAVAFHRPSMRVMLFGLIPVPLIVVAALYIITDLMGVTEQAKNGGSNIAHFAHLGGAIFGALSIIGAGSSKHFMNRVDRFFGWFKAPKFSFSRKPKMKVYQGSAQTKTMTDEEYNFNKKMRQDKLDAILDKIGKKGYDGLTKEEKDFLFNESQRK